MHVIEKIVHKLFTALEHISDEVPVTSDGRRNATRRPGPPETDRAVLPGSAVGNGSGPAL